jgi:hypothetical protein
MDDVNPLLPTAFDVTWQFLALVPLMVSIVAVVLILMSPRYTAGGKVLWIVTVLAVPLVGAIGWLLAGRTARLRTDVP